VDWPGMEPGPPHPEAGELPAESSHCHRSEIRVIFKYVFLTAQKIRCLFITKTNRLMLFREINRVYSKKHTMS
jgi:hypothetical protein